MTKPASASSKSAYVDWADVVLQNDTSLLDFYFNNGGNVHAKIVSSVGLCYANALVIAALHRRQESLGWCIRHGVGRNIDNKCVSLVLSPDSAPCGKTALLYACSTTPDTDAADDPACARLLIESGADLMERDSDGATALHLAVRARLPSIVRYLLTLVSDFPELLSAVTTGGITAFQCATTLGFTDIAAAIQVCCVVGWLVAQGLIVALCNCVVVFILRTNWTAFVRTRCRCYLHSPNVLRRMGPIIRSACRWCN